MRETLGHPPTIHKNLCAWITTHHNRANVEQNAMGGDRERIQDGVIIWPKKKEKRKTKRKGRK